MAAIQLSSADGLLWEKKEQTTPIHTHTHTSGDPFYLFIYLSFVHFNIVLNFDVAQNASKKKTNNKPEKTAKKVVWNVWFVRLKLALFKTDWPL